MTRSSRALAEREGGIFILSAPSGAGKTTLISRLLKIFPEMLLSVSYTTRPRRPGEMHGRDYFFVGKGKFAVMRARGGFAEWARVHGALYGTPRSPLDRSVRRGRDILLDIDVQGARKIKKLYPRAVSIFLLPPSWQELEKRLAGRGTDRRENIRRRLENARREIRAIVRYDYFLVNREIGEALASLKSIVVAERQRISRYKALGRQRSALSRIYGLKADG
ncbi:MAG: guanylate kinase [Deltaproteobacteria bacterium]|nr:guanylate kinase [Deltaproteobacteria bacterium]MBI2539175.1 guanylate kinase [Deltaproteobacteria bacterium]MBI3062769.1 guanylate kinase [Deltaproteobacteria bacterium]